jgi:hypothetical protein
MYNVGGFPTFKYFSYFNKEQKDYDGGRTAKVSQAFAIRFTTSYCKYIQNRTGDVVPVRFVTKHYSTTTT